MKWGLAVLCAAAVCAAAGYPAARAAAQAAQPVSAQTATPSPQAKMKACATEWKAKKSAHETGDTKYRDFVKECMSRAAAAPAAADPPVAATPAPPPAQPPAARPPGPRAANQPPAAPAPTAQGTPAAPTATGGDPVFPPAVSPKYASESAGKARMHTCLDQYHENKASGGNAGLNWIQKGGGYYSECNKRLKG